ncbi:MAG: Gfo/Idh/MocA family oxidoreductase, partial [Betaproteobacteria bacterium]
DGPDGIIVATPNRLHVPNGLVCARHRVPMLIEKPIADTVEDALRLCDAADEAGVPLLVGHHRRHSPLIVRAREVIEGGMLGRLVAVMGAALYHKPDAYFDEAPWRGQPGGGPILINMIHEVDDLRALCGEIVAVQATASNVLRGNSVEDTVAITLRFANGALGTFALSDTAAAATSWEQTSGENASYARYADEDCYLVAGTKGSLGVPSMRLRTFAGPSSWYESMQATEVAVERTDPLVRQLDHFCAVIRGETPPRVTGRDATRTLSVTLAISEAARTGQTLSTE